MSIVSNDETGPEVSLADAPPPADKAYIVGTLSLTAEGIWRMDYIGPHPNEARTEMIFGNGTVASRNIRELFDIVGSRLNHVKDIFADKILEIENAPITDESTDSDSPGRGDRADDGASVGGVLST